MFDYLQKFNSLSKDLRDKVSSASVMASLTELENRYHVDLAMVVMKVMIKEMALQDLPAYFSGEALLAPEKAADLTRELKEKVFMVAADHLGLAADKRAWDLDKDAGLLIKEAGLVLPSADLLGRFKNILAIYLRGVRSKIDTRASLSKPVVNGGLSLSDAEINRVLKICDSHQFKSLEIDAAAASRPVVPAGRLDKIIAGAEKISATSRGSAEEYNLKQVIADGRIKVPEKLDTKHELPAAEKQLDLPSPEEQLILPSSGQTAAKPVQSVQPKSVAPVKPPVPLRPTAATPADKTVLTAATVSVTPTAPTAPAVSPLAAAVPTRSFRPIPQGQTLQPLKKILPSSPVTPTKAKVKPSKPLGFWAKLFTSKKKLKLTAAKIAATPLVAKTPTVPTPPTASSVSKIPAVPSAPVAPKTTLTQSAPIAPKTPFAQSASSVPPTPLVPKVPVASKIPVASSVAQSAPPAPSAPVVPKTTLARPAPVVSASRPRLQDIKAVPKVMGPIEELQFLDVVNFRHLGQTPAEMTAKVLAKIKLLEKDGYDKMVAGVRAWRQSPVNRLYLRSGQEAIVAGISLKEAIEKRRQSGQDYLTREEIEAVVSLNGKLVF
ncbi:TPA: hypothetical protein DCZ15_02105 [Candidatus Falkowbacteria bacterium]|nr:MAG: hypothetical protein UV95_C0001G0184 [Candidatus Falkowbacteria bacterium GW2011_GWF2_43_32]HBA36648.1 hypothetical protein [Candidatus Falkowbacteria bacterium]